MGLLKTPTILGSDLGAIHFLLCRKILVAEKKISFPILDFVSNCEDDEVRPFKSSQFAPKKMHWISWLLQLLPRKGKFSPSVVGGQISRKTWIPTSDDRCNKFVALSCSQLAYRDVIDEATTDDGWHQIWSPNATNFVAKIDKKFVDRLAKSQEFSSFKWRFLFSLM